MLATVNMSGAWAIAGLINQPPLNKPRIPSPRDTLSCWGMFREIKELMVLRCRPTSIRLTTNILFTPVACAPFHSLTSVWHPRGRKRVVGVWSSHYCSVNALPLNHRQSIYCSMDSVSLVLNNCAMYQSTGCTVLLQKVIIMSILFGRLTQLQVSRLPIEFHCKKWRDC